MSKFQWLKDYQDIQQEIAYLETNLERSQNELKRWVSGDLTKYKLTAKSDGAQLEERIEFIKKTLNEKRKELSNINDFLAKFPTIDNRILFLKYIENKNLELIAEEIGYSVSHVQKRHAELVRIIHMLDKINA